MLDSLLTYWIFLLKILPGLVLLALFFILLKPNPQLRKVLYIFVFILIRDAMTPLKLWFIGEINGFIWIRFVDDAFFLIIFGISSLIIVYLLYHFDTENRKCLVWMKGNKIVGTSLGIAGAIVVVIPIFIAYRYIDVSQRGGNVATEMILPILIFALLANLFEETLFRGYALDFFSKSKSPITAGIYSGLAFAMCHVFLAISVTDTGIALLAFTLWEGIIAGIIGAKYGIIPATLTHGGAIFVLSSGLI